MADEPNEYGIVKPKPHPLDYERPTSAPRGEYVVFAVIAGFIVGVATLDCGSAVLYSGTHPLRSGWDRSERVIQAFVSAGAYAVLAAIAVIRAVRTFRSPRQPKRFFLAGFLLGIGLTALLESICFGAG